MKKLLVILFLISFALMTKGQIKLSGVVLDASTGQALPGANIRIENKLSGTFTGKDGSFELLLSSDSQVTLLISFVGYETLVRQINPAKSSRLRFELQPLAYLHDEIIIESTRLDEHFTAAVDNISKIKIKEINLGQDIPFLLQQSVSVVNTSDAGNGIGYTGIRIRGSDISRINVTLNGIPLNDAESHGVWFVDIPDLAGNVNNIQIQRGVSTSTNGAGSFGANINILTAELKEKPYAEYAISAGSFNTLKNTFSAGTGLISDAFTFDFKLSKQHTDGFIDRAFADLQSVFTTGAWYSKNSILRFTFISGDEKTYQAWNGVPKVRLLNDTAGMKRYLDHWLISEKEYENLINSDPRTYNIYTYKNETDNYKQQHYQLHYSRKFQEKTHFNATFHYTRGMGYYEQFKEGQKFSKYGLPDPVIGNDTISKTDLIRQKWLDNHFFGMVWSVSVNNRQSTWMIGGSANDYLGDHYGNIIWAEQAQTVPKDYQWYLNTGDKKEAAIFGKYSGFFSDKLIFYADLQYRFIHYSIDGIHDDLRDLSMEKSYHFVNPKTGLSINIDQKSKAYLSFGMASREPSRNEFRDADEHYNPLPEHLFDLETGYQFTSERIAVKPNLFFMYYKNQLVQTGKINDVGSPVMTNVPQSYRTGIEITAQFKFNKLIEYEYNIAISSNKIINFTEYVDDWDNGGQRTNFYKSTNISFSPKIVSSGTLNFTPLQNLKVMLLSKYVGRQFIDNTSNPENSLDAYFVNDLIFSYHFKTNKAISGDFSLKISNLLNHEYESNAWVYRYYFEGNYYSMDGYFPQAGRFYLTSLTLKI